jgi:hypothetical protein
LAIALFALKHQRKLRALNRAAERAPQLVGTARRVAANPRLRKEVRLALAAIALASGRAREVGVVRAPRDRRLASQLRHAGQHASKAMTIAERLSRKRRNVRKTATITIGAGAVGGAAYAGWKLYGRPQPDAVSSPLSQAAQPPTDSSPPAARGDELNRAHSNGEATREEDDVL